MAAAGGGVRTGDGRGVGAWWGQPWVRGGRKSVRAHRAWTVSVRLMPKGSVGRQENQLQRRRQEQREGPS